MCMSARLERVLVLVHNGRMSETRQLDHGTPPERFARGWHCLGLAETFRDGKPHGIDAFGGKVVVWQDSAGEINVLDGYCRHMGGDLTQGSVKGDEIACPFHDWRWGGDGKCKAIPYARRIPLRARTQKYETVERNGLLMVWHDPEGSPADHDVLPPELENIMDPDVYTDWSWNVLDVPSAHAPTPSRRWPAPRSNGRTEPWADPAEASASC